MSAFYFKLKREKLSLLIFFFFVFFQSAGNGRLVFRELHSPVMEARKSKADGPAGSWGSGGGSTTDASRIDFAKIQTGQKRGSYLLYIITRSKKIVYELGGESLPPLSMMWGKSWCKHDTFDRRLPELHGRVKSISCEYKTFLWSAQLQDFFLFFPSTGGRSLISIRFFYFGLMKKKSIFLLRKVEYHGMRFV